MGIRSADHDTVPCPPPDECGAESGEFSSVDMRVSLRSSHPAPRYARAIEEEVRERLAAIRCPEHGQSAETELTVGKDGAVQVIPVGCCCQELERLVIATLRESVTIAPPGLPDVPMP